MNKSIPKSFLDDWKSLHRPAVFTTVDKMGVPNSIWVGCFKLLNENQILIANNKFHKTYENILSGSYGAFLFITNNRKSYQAKGHIEYHTKGPVYEKMKRWIDPKYPGYAAAVLNIEAIYCGSEKIF